MRGVDQAPVGIWQMDLDHPSNHHPIQHLDDGEAIEIVVVDVGEVGRVVAGALGVGRTLGRKADGT